MASDQTTGQPIETAPQDGTVILVGNHLGWWMAKYEPIYQSGYRLHGGPF